MTGHMLMSEKERERKVILSQVASGHFTLKEAAIRLLLSYGQMKRLWKRYQTLGDEGLIHRGRGRASNHKKPFALKQAVLAYYESNYLGFGPTLAAEKLQATGY